jgi:hypothetical protein
MVAAVDGRVARMDEQGIHVSAEAQAIEAFFRRRFGREALYLPSARLGLYLVLREWLRPGDRLLMSPVNCDVVFFTVLAAGLVPVLAPVDPGTGNIDPAGIDDSTWASLHAVVTTNLYGVPDRMDLLQESCRRHRLLLVEDACHAIDSRFEGRRLGKFGMAAVYSLAKQVGGVGAVVTFAEENRRESLARHAAREIRYRSPARSAAARIRALVSSVGASTRARRRLARLRDRLVRRPSGRSGHRLPYEVNEVLQAQSEGGGLERFDRWLQVDKPEYRTWPLRFSLRTTLERLETFEENSRLRVAGTGKLLSLGYTPASFRVPAGTGLFRVPLFVQEREKVGARLAQHDLRVDYIYDPPLDLYAPALTDSLPSPSAAAIWSRDVLPIDPLCADRFLALLRELPELCLPSREAIRYAAGHQQLTTC